MIPSETREKRSRIFTNTLKFANSVRPVATSAARMNWEVFFTQKT